MQTTTLRSGFAILLGMYLTMAAWVWSGSVLTSGGETGPWALLQMGSAIAASVALYLAIPRGALGLRGMNSTPGYPLALSLALVLTALVAVHWYLLGGPPVLHAIAAYSDIGAGLVRNQITDVSVPLANYIPTLVIKTGVPFLIIYFSHLGRNRLAVLLLLVGLAYAVSLMQKAYPLYVIAPPAIYFLLRGAWVKSGLSAAAGVASVILLVLITNPSMFGGGVADAPAVSEPTLKLVAYEPGDVMAPEEIAIEVVSLVAWRVLVDPGLSVNLWFEAFPDSYPFTGGCSYRFLAPVLGCQQVEASKIVWRHYYPDLEAKGYDGSSGAAHFMEEYAAFGIVGLPVASLLVVVALLGAAFVSSRSGIPLLVAMNMPFVFALSSTGLHTTMLSGGWAFALMMVALMPINRATT